MKNRGLTRNICIWLLGGILLAYAAGVMAASHSINISDFHNDGEIYQMRTDGKNVLDLAGCHYEKESGRILIDSSDAKVTFQKANEGVQYYYLRIKVSNLNRDNVAVKFCFYNKEDVRIAQQENLLGNGENMYTIPVAGEISRLKMMFTEQQGSALRLDNVELREKTPHFSKKLFACAGAAVFVIYLIISVLWRQRGYAVKSRKWKESAEGLKQCLQMIYMIQEAPAAWLHVHLPQKMHHSLRVALFTLLCSYMSLMEYFGIYDAKNYYKFHIIFASFVIIIMGWLLYDGKLEYQKWDTFLINSWFILWISVCIGDAIMGSRYVGTGYVMIIAFGTLFFFWSNQKKGRAMLLIEIAEGIGIYLLLYIAFFIVKTAVTGNIDAVIDIPTKQELIIAWKSYIGDLNLIGHSVKAKTGGRTVWIYNGIFEMVYRYGIFILIPYVMFFTDVFCWTRCYMKKTGIRSLVLTIQILFFLSLFTQNAERPFLSPFWIAFYLHVGYFFGKRKNKG